MKKLLDNKALKVIVMLVKTIITLFIVLVVSVVFIQRISDNKVTLGGFSLFTIVSESMVPKYQVGDMLLAKKVDPSTINIGDDIVYIGNTGDFKDKVVTHQVIKKDHYGDYYSFTTKGLANPVEDPIIRDKQIYGLVIHKSIILSFLSKLLNNVYGFYFLVFIPFVVILFLEIIETIDERKKLKRYQKR